MDDVGAEVVQEEQEPGDGGSEDAVEGGREGP